MKTYLTGNPLKLSLDDEIIEFCNAQSSTPTDEVKFRIAIFGTDRRMAYRMIETSDFKSYMTAIRFLTNLGLDGLIFDTPTKSTGYHAEFHDLNESQSTPVRPTLKIA